MLHSRFIDTSRGRLFCTFWHAQDSNESTVRMPAVVVVPAFGDEMSKSRRMVALLGQSLCERGVILVNPDLLGTGDSDGEFENVSWSDWISDIQSVVAWCKSNDWQVRGWVTIRTGSLLLNHYLNSYPPTEAPYDVIQWQPVDKGLTFIRQLLRVRTMQQLVGHGIAESVDDLLDRLLQGEEVEVAGYILTQSLVQPMCAPIVQSPSLPSPRTLHRLSTKGGQREMEIQVVENSPGNFDVTTTGGRYWNSTEILVNQPVLEYTVETLLQLHHA